MSALFWPSVILLIICLYYRYRDPNAVMRMCLRATYREYARVREAYDCGNAMAYEMSPRLCQLRDHFNKLARTYEKANPGERVPRIP